MPWRPWVLVAGSALLMASAATAQDAKYRLKPGAGGRVCLECHADFKEAVAQPFVHTPVKTGNCAGCHDPHASDHGKLLEADPNRICAKCHPNVVPKDAASIHDPVGQGNCVQCHDPHASKNRYNLRLAGNELCLGCHKDLGKSVEASEFQHAPAQRDCLACHDPHASRTRALLAKVEPDLCLRCHNPALPIFSKAHAGYPVAKSRCTSCHDPHGSSNRGILWASVHRPVATRMCAQCHEGASSPNAVRTRKAGSDLCRGCHNDLFNETFAKNRIHWPVVDATGCRNCHSPHASKTPKLLLTPPKTLCGSCHADAVARQEKSATKHPPVADGACSTCHAPHSSNSAFLLAAADVSALCGTCHDWQQHSSHPLGEKVADQRNRNLTLDCLSCHRTHGTPFQHLAYLDTKSDLCVQCHTRLTR